MKKNTVVAILTAVAMSMLLSFGQQARAAEKKPLPFTKLQPRHRVNPENAQTPSNPPAPANLYALGQWFGALPPQDSSGNDEWPCAGGSTTGDCTGIAAGGLVVADFSYTWSLANCDGNTSTSPYCGQEETWYEDDTNDTTDDLLYQVTVTQGTGSNLVYVADTGLIDYQTNTAGGGGFTGDVNFGTQGVPTGPNNGNCIADINYPLAAIPPTAGYLIQANKTCVDPSPGLATITALTEIATPTYAMHTTQASCGGTTPPCWTVKYTKKYSIMQKWNIWLQ